MATLSFERNRPTIRVAKARRRPVERDVLHVETGATQEEPGAFPKRPSRLAVFARDAAKAAATLCMLGLAVIAALVVWNYYVTAPWTRDGRVRVQVASVAPLVSGQITEVRVVDNQYVRKGDVLYVIDPFDFRVTLDTGKALLRQRAADLEVKRMQAERRQHLSNLATTPEEQQLFVGAATQAQAAFDSAQQQVAQADINLKRTQVRSPVNGYVTNLLMRVGDFAHEGVTNISVIDADSFWIDGYFEETKMANVCIGDYAEAKLIGYRDPIVGKVLTVTRGISVSNAAPSTQGLPSVDPIYTWIRLAQRVPVRIQITHVPSGVPLLSGMTATVAIRGAEARQTDWGGLSLAGLMDRLRDIFEGSRPAAGCVPRITDDHGAIAILETPTPAAPLSPAQLEPGLAPQMDVSPHVR